MKRIITIAVMLTCVMACTFAQSIVGKWKATPETIKAMGLGEDGSTSDVFFTFNANKTHEILYDYKLETTVEGIPVKLVVIVKVPGSYTAQNNALSLKTDSKRVTTSPDLSFPGMDKEKSDFFKGKMEPIMKEQKEVLTKTILDSFGKDLNGFYKISGNTLDFDGMKYTRVR